jgi:hypothetical protein
MNAGSMTEIWVYLSAQPLLWLTLTLAAYLLAITLHRKAGGHPAPTRCSSRWASWWRCCSPPTHPTSAISMAPSSCTSCSAPPPWPSPCRSTAS